MMLDDNGEKNDDVDNNNGSTHHDGDTLVVSTAGVGDFLTGVDDILEDNNVEGKLID